MVKAALTLFSLLPNSSAIMIGPKSVLLATVALIAACLVAPPGGASAQQAPTRCRLCADSGEASSDARPAEPLRLEVRSRLDFDSVIYAGLGQGSLAIEPDGSARPSGPVDATGARAMPGSVTVRGEAGRAVRVELPRMVRLYGDRGGMLQIDSIVSDLPANPQIGQDGELSFRFGGNLKVEGDVDGAFRGDVDISVDYL